METPETRPHPDNCGVCTGYEVPAEWVTLAESHYSHHGSGLVYNLLATVLPVALSEVTAELEQMKMARDTFVALFEEAEAHTTSSRARAAEATGMQLRNDVDELTAERDRLLVALRSAHCELYAGGPVEKALDIIDAALDSHTTERRGTDS